MEGGLRIPALFKKDILVAMVNPAYTSQNCSRCGERNPPKGKKYVCEHCGHTDHRDANAAFNIAKRGAESISISMGGTRTRGA